MGPFLAITKPDIGASQCTVGVPLRRRGGPEGHWVHRSMTVAPTVIDRSSSESDRRSSVNHSESSESDRSSTVNHCRLSVNHCSLSESDRRSSESDSSLS